MIFCDSFKFIFVYFYFSKPLRLGFKVFILEITKFNAFSEIPPLSEVVTSAAYACSLVTTVKNYQK